MSSEGAESFVPAESFSSPLSMPMPGNKSRSKPVASALAEMLRASMRRNRPPRTEDGSEKNSCRLPTLNPALRS